MMKHVAAVGDGIPSFDWDFPVWNWVVFACVVDAFGRCVAGQTHRYI